ncbi:hypothetical protein VTO73DRAFT_7529 [Trametes versicolor]
MADVLGLASALFSELTAFVGHKDVVVSRPVLNLAYRGLSRFKHWTLYSPNLAVWWASSSTDIILCIDYPQRL